MTIKEELKKHLEIMNTKEQALRKAQEDWQAYNRAFNAWLQANLGIADEKREVHLAEILTKWNEVNDNASKISN